MSDIPSELFGNILHRVPAESLLLWRGVCKSWRRLIDDPDFIKSHIKHQSSSTSLGQLLIRNENGGRLSSLSLDSINFVRHDQTIEETKVKNLIGRGLPRLTTLPVTSCNGLILISRYEAKKIWVLWNPLTQDYHELPECDADSHLEGWGLGYDCVDDDYKVVRINLVFLNEGLVHKTYIYSLKFNSWKWIKDCPGDFHVRSQGLYLNGALYWLSKSFIIALDLSTEDYRQLPLPSLRTDPYRREDRKMNLDVLGGCLVLSCKDNYRKDRFEGWAMKDDGGKISWTKLFSLKELEDIGAMGQLRPITYSKSNRRVLIQHNNKHFFWLNTVNNSAKKIRMQGLSRNFSCQVWKSNLFRLGNIVGGAKRTGRVKKMRAKKRLKLDVTISKAGDWADLDYTSCSSEGEEDY
ncbi:hypothetical protein BUALT_Bualt12G0085900 [Buddleja alternifolia]|uniref:F-box domain-containing protein n=1 Tax=Buddleja alternifolia TaxID=168488 RepID=A0AAV6X0D7_9LAMI|nr:hypothetical protein BUALT_Bualt12G0085900 [Buddleja alternifolia]